MAAAVTKFDALLSNAAACLLACVLRSNRPTANLARCADKRQGERIDCTHICTIAHQIKPSHSLLAQRVSQPAGRPASSKVSGCYVYILDAAGARQLDSDRALLIARQLVATGQLRSTTTTYKRATLRTCRANLIIGLTSSLCTRASECALAC